MAAKVATRMTVILNLKKKFKKKKKKSKIFFFIIFFGPVYILSRM